MKFGLFAFQLVCFYSVALFACLDSSHLAAIGTVILAVDAFHHEIKIHLPLIHNLFTHRVFVDERVLVN